jgi:hypothetical protein
MKIDKYLDIHAVGKHIEDRGKEIEHLVDRVLRNERLDKPIDKKMWKRDLIQTITEIHKELEAVENIIIEEKLNENATEM